MTKRSTLVPLLLVSAFAMLMVTFWSLSDPETLALPFLQFPPQTGKAHGVRPSSSSPAPFRAAITVLTGPVLEGQTLSSLESLALHTPFDRPYPVILFHTTAFDRAYSQPSLIHAWEARIAEVRRAGNEVVAARMEGLQDGFEFVKINLDAPQDVFHLQEGRLIPIWDRVKWSDKWPSYQTTQRFWATQLFSHPRISSLDYFLHIDPAASLLTPLCEDPFQTMANANLSYASRVEVPDEPEFIVGLRDWMKGWSDEHEDLVQSGGLEEDEMEQFGLPSVKVWDSAFEIVHVPSFQTPAIQTYIKDLEDYHEGFYRHRWGTPALRHTITSLFIPPERTRLFCEFGYHHGVELEATCSCPA